MTPISARYSFPSVKWLFFVAVVNITVGIFLCFNSVTLAEDELLPPEQLSLNTSDGISLAVWYYPVPKDLTPKATVLVIHDMGGSHKSVEPLSIGLQSSGYAVLAPDLRGHGESPITRNGKTVTTKALRKADVSAMAAARGRLRYEQNHSRGDLETIHQWIYNNGESLDINRLCVVGCGDGATVGTLWAVTDSLWPKTTQREPQGGHVRAIALISPSLTARGGVTMLPALKTNLFRGSLPILLLSGSGDRDARRLTDQLIQIRPKQWMIRGPGSKKDQAEEVESASDASVICMQLNTSVAADELAGDASAKVPSLVATFFDMALKR